MIAKNLQVSIAINFNFQIENNKLEKKERMMLIFKFDCDVRIVDEIMGRGKTTSAIRFINESDDDEKFMFITPYLKEVERIKTDCPTKRFKEPCFIKGRK